MADEVPIPPLRQGVGHPPLEAAAESSDARKSVPGAGRRTYSGKGTPTLTVMAMGRRVSRLDKSEETKAQVAEVSVALLSAFQGVPPSVLAA